MKTFLVLLALIQTAAAATLTNGYTIGSGLLGSSVIIDNAATGGGDSSSSTGSLGWTAELAGLCALHYYCQPCTHFVASVNSLQLSIKRRLLITASISTS